MSLGVSIVVPAYREEANIEAAIDSVIHAVESVTKDYEVIVIDDGSADRTGEFARLKSEANPNVRVAVNVTNQGFGYSFARGIKMATKEFVTVFPGDNDMSARSLKDLIEARGSVDLVISERSRENQRSLFRRFVSWCFVLVFNLLFGLRLKYYNGAFICRRVLLQSIPIRSSGLATLAECVVRLLKKGASFRVITFDHVGRKHERSKAFNLKSICAVSYTAFILIKDLYFLKKDPA